jgi:hypothetical protein
MVSSNVPHADIVAHYDQDIGFLPLLLARGRNARHSRGGTHHEQSAPDFSERAHWLLFSLVSAAEGASVNLGRLPEHAISLRQGATHMLIQINEGRFGSQAVMLGSSERVL